MELVLIGRKLPVVFHKGQSLDRYVDILLSCSSAEVLLFADEIILTTIGCTLENLKSDLENFDNWSLANKLVQMNVKSSAGYRNFELNYYNISVESVCKYLGFC